MSKTYTYTARSADNAAQVVTLTLQADGLLIEPGPIGSLASTLENSSLETKASLLSASTAWLKMTTLLEELDKPQLGLADVDAGIDKNCLRLMAWGHSRDRRWLPITLVIDRVDNAEGAAAFVTELNRRKASILRRKRVKAVIGSRPYWFLGGSLATVVALVSLRSKRG